MGMQSTPLTTASDPVMTRAEQYTSLANLPAGTWQTLATRRYATRLPKGLDAGYDKVSGWVVPLKPRRALTLKQADAVCALEPKYADLTDDELHEALLGFREAFRRRRETKDDLVTAYAAIREAAKRTMGMQPYRVQVAAGLGLSAGYMVEMATGEGKSLTATLPAVVAGWRGRGCHVITVNDYLAARDAREFKPLYKFCGLTVLHVDGSMHPPERRAGYHADVTYLTNKEVAADFLRDRLTLGRLTGLTETLLHKIMQDDGMPGFTRTGPEHLVMRGLETAIIDEADSILVDEAVTPLIISAEAENASQLATYPISAHLATQLEETVHFKLTPKYREVDLTDAGRDRVVELIDALPEEQRGYFKGSRLREELVTQALTARHMFHKGQHYVVMDGKAVIVDESTGRLMPDRTWRAGLHQAVEAKEQLEVSPVKDTLARISFQRFFRLYRQLSGMSGTLLEAQRELWTIYKCPVVTIPTNMPLIREQMPDRLHATQDAKWDGVVEEVVQVHKTGRPILIGTRSVSDSELLSERLTAKGLEHVVLNAVKHEEEAEIVVDAGQKGRITVATNMAGRGTDIKLGQGIAEKGGLHVIATERNESRRVDRQLFGRAGRQGDPGSAVLHAAYDDELIRRHAKGKTAGGVATFRKAQNRAQRLNRAQRQGVLRSDDWLDEYLGFAGREH